MSSPAFAYYNQLSGIGYTTLPLKNISKKAFSIVKALLCCKYGSRKQLKGDKHLWQN